MASFSQANVLGNLGQDPETRFTQNGKMNVSFSVATNRRWTDSSGQPQENTTWFRVTAWGQLADTVNKLAEDGYLKKGSQVFVSGRLESRDWTDRNGVNRTSLEVSANEVRLVGGRGDEGEGGAGSGSRTGGRPDEDTETFDGNDMEDVPF